MISSHRRSPSGATSPATFLLAIALSASALALSAAPAHAQDAARYQMLIEQALQEFEAGHFEEARAFFRQAHREIPNPRTLRGIAMASYELRDYVDTYRALRRALSFGPTDRDLSPEQRQSASALLDRARALIAVVTGVPAGATVTMDGQPTVVDPDRSVPVPLGSHQLVARTTDGRSTTRAVEVSGGETIAWAVPTAPPVAAQQPVIRPIEPVPPPVEEPVEEAPPYEEPPADEAPPDHRALRDDEAAPRRDEAPPVERAPEEDEGAGPRLRLNVLGFVGVGGFESYSAYYGAVPVGGAVGFLVQLSDMLALGVQVGGTYASLFETNTYSDTSWWGSVDVLAWGELRVPGTPLAIGLGAGGAVGFRQKSVIEDGYRYLDPRFDGAFALAADVRVYFADDLLFVAAEGRFAVGDYGAAAGVLAFGVEPVR